MLQAEGMGPHLDAKQRVELSKDGVGPASEPPKPKVCPLALLTNHSGCFCSPCTLTDAGALSRAQEH